MNSIEIYNLLDRQEYLEEVSGWIWKEWSYEHGAKLEDVIYRSNHSLSKSGIPSMYIAVLKGEVVGVVSLWRNDLTTRQDLYPWMATLYVKESFRGQGVGRRLQEKSIAVAKELGYSYLYLIKDHIGYYEKFGWTFLETAPLGNGKYTRIYQYCLKP